MEPYYKLGGRGSRQRKEQFWLRLVVTAAAAAAAAAVVAALY